MFEAGALSKQLDSSHVCPILFDVDNSELKGPLVQFQATPFNRPEVKKLISTINKALGEHKLEESVLNSVFDMWWPRLEEQIKNIIQKFKKSGSTKETSRPEREILEEILALTRMSVKRSVPRSRPKEEEIDPDAFIYLTKKYCELFEMAHQQSMDDGLKDTVTSIKGVIEYLFHRGAKTAFEYDEVSSLLETLDGRYQN
ncbi:hypothetical protein [Stutzerimonas stutzeri]|uniref:hypothetical protein n=1 Tax=Stutzerimonas stutzeri TaxID=316 RepID=UPI0013FDFB72|nr:hypothetical protein [Stutzerimonas stutzeri]